jgi:hypothetical protein
VSAAAWSVSVRESRMCVERILLTCGIPSGFVHGVRDCVLLSEALGLGGFAYLLENHARLDWSRHALVRAEDAGSSLRVDGGGAHAWLLLPTLVDLAVDVARRNGVARVLVSNVEAALELRVAAALAHRYGARITGESIWTVMNAARPLDAAQRDPLLHRAMLKGFEVDGALWRAVHELSNRALAPDSVASRRHAGPVVLGDDGELLGRVPQDDDFDMNMLTKVNSK